MTLGRAAGSFLTVGILILLNASCFFCMPEIISPSNEGEAYGDNVKIIIKSFDNPDFDIFVDGRKEHVGWEKEAWPFRWITWVSVSEKGFHEIALRKNGETLSSIRFNNNLSIEEIAHEVISRYSFENPPEGLKWDWAPAVLMYGLLKFAPCSRYGEEYIEYVKKYHQNWLDEGIPEINWADECPSALSAYMLYQDFSMDFALEAVLKAVSYVESAPRNNLGSINHLGSSPFSIVYPDSIWVDSLMMWALLSAKYGISSNDNELAGFGIDQQFIFSERLKDHETGLYHHAWNVKSGSLIPEDNALWLRGNAWVMVSQLEMISEIGDSHEKYLMLSGMFKDLAQSTLKFRQPSGYWDTVMSEPGYAYEESSGSALIAYAYAKGFRMGLLDETFMDAARDTFSSITARLKRSDNGLAVADISSGTIPSSRLGYKLVPVSDNIPYGVGAWLLLASEMIISGY